MLEGNKGGPTVGRETFPQNQEKKRKEGKNTKHKLFTLPLTNYQVSIHAARFFSHGRRVTNSALSIKTNPISIRLDTGKTKENTFFWLVTTLSLQVPPPPPTRKKKPSGNSLGGKIRKIRHKVVINMQWK